MLWRCATQTLATYSALQIWHAGTCNDDVGDDVSSVGSCLYHANRTRTRPHSVVGALFYLIRELVSGLEWNGCDREHLLRQLAPSKLSGVAEYPGRN